MKHQEGMPQQCIDTGKAITGVYGHGRGLEVIESRIESLTEAVELLKYFNADKKLILKIAIQIDFWTQTKESVKPTNR